MQDSHRTCLYLVTIPDETLFTYLPIHEQTRNRIREARPPPSYLAIEEAVADAGNPRLSIEIRQMKGKDQSTTLGEEAFVGSETRCTSLESVLFIQVADYSATSSSAHR